MPEHGISPVYDSSSRILILGSFPSVASREEGFFYAYPRNRFWKVISYLTGSTEPDGIEKKKELLLSSRIALWDVIASCTLKGSSDSSIKNVKANDIRPLLEGSGIIQVFTNGKKAHELYMRYIYPVCGMRDICLPSTSPANAACALEELIVRWGVITEYLNTEKHK